MTESSTAQAGETSPNGQPRRDNAARLKLLGGLLRLDALRPNGFTAQELAAYAEVEPETARAFLSVSKGPGFAELLSNQKAQTRPDGSGRPANLYRVRPASREALLKHLADIRRPLAAAESSCLHQLTCFRRLSCWRRQFRSLRSDQAIQKFGASVCPKRGWN